MNHYLSKVFISMPPNIPSHEDFTMAREGTVHSVYFSGSGKAIYSLFKNQELVAQIYPENEKKNYIYNLPIPVEQGDVIRARVQNNGNFTIDFHAIVNVEYTPPRKPLVRQR